jgi:choline dehydrogenase-like flavoprotein
VIENGELGKSTNIHRFQNPDKLIKHALANSNETDYVRDRITWKAEPWWLYNITSFPNKELNNLESTVYAGSLVGGGSAINGMQCVRGTVEDYDRWGGFFGSGSTWTWDGILPYFKKVCCLFEADLTILLTSCLQALHFQPPSEEAVEQMPGLKYDESYWGDTSRLYAGWPTFQWPGISERLRCDCITSKVMLIHYLQNTSLRYTRRCQVSSSPRTVE